MNREQRIENYNKAIASAGFLVGELQDAYTNAGQFESMLVYPLIERAALLKRDVERMMNAAINERE